MPTDLMASDSTNRDQVADRAGHCCEYCHLPEAYTSLPFQLDHVIAVKHEGANNLENLAYACLHCNSFKGPNLAGFDHERRRTIRLFNLREDKWSDHFSWKGPILWPKTFIGRVTIQVLRINLPDRVAVREALIEEGVFPPPDEEGS